MQSCEFKFVFVYHNGPPGTVLVNGSDIKSTEDCDCQKVVSDVDPNRLEMIYETKELFNRISTLI